MTYKIYMWQSDDLKKKMMDLRSRKRKRKGRKKSGRVFLESKESLRMWIEEIKTSSLLLSFNYNFDLF